MRTLDHEEIAQSDRYADLILKQLSVLVASGADLQALACGALKASVCLAQKEATISDIADWLAQFSKVLRTLSKQGGQPIDSNIN